MKKLLLFCWLVCPLTLLAQTSEVFLKEINRDIWLPFFEAYGQNPTRPDSQTESILTALPITFKSNEAF